MIECEKEIRYLSEDMAIRSYLDMLTSNTIQFAKVDDTYEIDYYDVEDFTLSKVNSIKNILQAKNDNMKTYRIYVYQNETDHNPDLNLAPIGEDIKAAHVIMEYSNRELVLRLNPYIDNPYMYREEDGKEYETEASKAEQEYIRDISQKVTDYVISMSENLALKVMNTNFSEEEIKEIFTNLSNSDLLKFISMLDRTFYDTLKAFSESTKPLSEKMKFQRELERQLNGVSEQMDDFSERMNSLEEKYDKMLSITDKEPAEDITEKLIESIIEDQRFSDRIRRLIEDELEEMTLERKVK